jgi:hypothetical protein
MRFATSFVLVLAVPLAAQNWPVPDNFPDQGNCNVIPFGQSVGGPFYQSKYQTRCTAADLGATPNLLTGLGFAACATGRSHFDSMEVVIDHIPAAQPTSTTFASNLTPAAITVLSASNYTWNTTTNVWNEIGLQVPFVYNGVDDIIVQITMVNGISPMGFHRGARQRVYWIAASGTAPATGSTDSAAGKIEVSMLMARTASLGDGCVGSNGTPTISFTGTPQQATTLSLDLTNGLPSGIGLFIAGTMNGFPFPFDLTPIGAPGCFAYTDLAFTSAMLLDPLGAGSFVLPIPPSVVGFRFFAQYAVLDPLANPFGFTTSNYLNVLTGN